jgi:outer membrane protein TolC
MSGHSLFALWIGLVAAPLWVALGAARAHAQDPQPTAADPATSSPVSPHRAPRSTAARALQGPIAVRDVPSADSAREPTGTASVPDVPSAAAEPAPLGAAAPIEPAARTLRDWGEAKALLIAHQPSLQEQLAALQRAQASVQQAWSELLPRLDLGAGTDYRLVRPIFFGAGQPAQHAAFDERTLVPSANASLSITFSLAGLARLDSAQSGAAAERLGLEATRHQLLGQLASSVLGLLSAERVAARNRAGLEAAQERMRLTERLVALGKATSLDALRFEQDLSEAQSNLVSANEALSQGREALGGALGLRDAVGLAGEFDPLGLLSPQVSGCRSLAGIEDRPDRRAAALRSQQANGARRAASYAYLPELRLTSQYLASYGQQPSAFVTLEPPRGLLHDWSANANLVWTLYDGGARSALVDTAAADAAAARAQQERTAIASGTEVRSSWRLVQVSQANLEIAQRSASAAREMDRLSRKALELGSASALEVVDAARRLRATEITVAAREVEAVAAQVRAYMALAVCR